jgi:ribosomal protein S18 acetylase RimI-like enzyme
MADVRIETIKDFQELAYERIRDLLQNLYPGRPTLSEGHYKAVLQNDHTRIFIAVKDDEIVGTSTLVQYYKLAGNRWVIEDVVVDERMRGQGIGRLLTEAILETARKAGADFVDLDTRSEEAYHFYLKLGFRNRAQDKALWSLRIHEF